MENNIYADTPSGTLQEEFNVFARSAKKTMALYNVNNGKKMNYEDCEKVLREMMEEFIKDIKKEVKNGSAKLTEE